MAENSRWLGIWVMGSILGMGCAAPVSAPELQAMAASNAIGPAAAARTAGSGGGAMLAGLSPIEDALRRADAYFITQYRHRRYNPNQPNGNNANCGPTSLAMALRGFGLAADGAEQSRELIKKVRLAMTGVLDEGAWTYPFQVRDGARKLGLRSRTVFTLAEIKKAMAVPGRMVVLNLNPAPAYVDRLALPYNGGHFALLTRIEGNRAFISDPLADGPIEISLGQLETALTTPLGRDPYGNHIAAYNGGVLVWQ